MAAVPLPRTAIDFGIVISSPSITTTSSTSVPPVSTARTSSPTNTGSWQPSYT